MGKRRRQKRQSQASSQARAQVAAGHGSSERRHSRGGRSANTFLGVVEGYEQARNIRPALLWAMFAFVLMLPHFFGVKEKGYDHEQYSLLESVGHATVYAGDEPHYMTITSSVINDGDLDLKNNYASSHAGGVDSGARFGLITLDHHSYWYLPDEGYRWWRHLVETDPRYLPPPARWRWANESRTAITFDYKEEYQHLADGPEYTWHPPMMAVMGYPFLRLFKDSPLLEPAALFLSYLVTLMAAVFTYWCLGAVTRSTLMRFTAVFIIFLASPVWHYSRTLFTEPYITAFLMCAFACYYRGRGIAVKHLGSSLFVGLAVPLKSFAVLTMMPLFLPIIRGLRRPFEIPGREWLGAVVLGVGPVLGVLAMLYWHYLQTGDPLLNPAGDLTDTPDHINYLTFSAFLPNIFKVVFSPNYGVLAFCPALIPAAYGWWKMLDKNTLTDIGIALLMALPYYLFICLYTGADGGYAYGPRYMTAVLPLLLLGIIGFLMHADLRRHSTKIMWGLIALSFLINASAAIASWKFWTRHPIEALFGVLF